MCTSTYPTLRRPARRAAPAVQQQSNDTDQAQAAMIARNGVRSETRWNSGSSRSASVVFVLGRADISTLLGGRLTPSTRTRPIRSELDLQPVDAGRRTYAGLDVDGYAYSDPARRRVVVAYMSDEPFPEAPGAHLLAGPDGAWVVERRDVIILCARVPHALRVVG